MNGVHDAIDAESGAQALRVERLRHLHRVRPTKLAKLVDDVFAAHLERDTRTARQLARQFLRSTY